MITDPQGIIERVNESFTQITGYQAAEVIGNTPRMLHSGRHGSDFYDAIWQAVEEKGHWEGEIWNRRKDGEIYPQWEAISAIYDRSGRLEHYLAVFHEISQQKRLERELEHLATHDRLTGIFNRTKLYELLEAAEGARDRYGAPFSIIMFDIDHFKAVNDRFGHQVGDAVLQELTRRVRNSLRAPDHVGRWGGEEFLVLASHTRREGARQLAERIRRAVGDLPFPGVGRVTISLGVAEMQSRIALEDLEERADTALYAAKDAGRNRVCVAGGAE